MGEEERRQREAEEKAKSILEKKLEDEKRKHEAEAKAIEQKKLEDERRLREAEELQAKILEEERRQRQLAEARAKALQEKAIEDERRQREAKAAAEEEKKRKAEARAQELKEKLLEEERRQQEESKAFEEKRKREAEAEALQAKRIEDERIQREAEIERAAEEEKEKAAAEARALEAKKEEKESLLVSYETLEAAELEDRPELGLVVETIPTEDDEEEKKHMEAESKQIGEESNDALWKRIETVMQMNGLESIIKDTNIANNSRMAGNLIITAVNVGLAVVGSRCDGNMKSCQGPRVLDLSFVLDRHIDLLYEHMVRPGHYHGLIEDARGLLQKTSPSEMHRWLANSGS